MRIHSAPLGAATRRRVLLVDDDEVTLEVLAAMLSTDGHETCRAPDRESALKRLAASSPKLPAPDVLFLDLQMPGLSDSDFLHSARALAGDTFPLVAMSAAPVKPEALHGFHGFLLKPPTLDQLRLALADAAGAAQHRGNAETSLLARKRKVLAERKNNKQPRAAGDQDGIDRAVLGKLSQTMPRESLLELYRICLVDTRARLAELRQLADAGRVEEMRRSAHQIKGAAAMIGASRIAQLAASLELGSYNHEDTLSRIADLLSACGDVESILLEDKLL